jgi:phosphatidylglycerol lysyltransferase
VRLRRLIPLVGLIALPAALVVLHRALAHQHWRELVGNLRAIPVRQIVLASGLTALNYALLTAYDALALRAIGRRLDFAKTAATAFMAFAFSHNVGYAVISGGSIRYRFYATWGLSTADITAITLLGAAAFWLGFFAVGGAALCAWPPQAGADWQLGIDPRLLGAIALTLAAAAVVAMLMRRRPLRVRTWELPPPPPIVVAELLLVGCLDWLLVAGVVYSLLPPGAIGFAHFVACFIVAQALGVASQVPGGLGVFEAGLLLMIGDRVSTPALAGALIAYRGIYYLAPFVAAMGVMLALESLRQRVRLGRAAEAVRRVARPLMPHALAALTFAAGAVLLFSGATPAIASRLQRLHQWVPLAVVEASHFLASLCGVVLILLARGLQLRLREAFVTVWGALIVGAALSLLKGIDYEEALVLLVLALGLLPFQRGFTRRSAMARELFTARWSVAIATVLLCSFWLTLVSYRVPSVAAQSWWQVELSADAPRSLRASLGAAVLLAAVALWRLLRPGWPRPPTPSPDELMRARAAIARAPDALGNLALTGDKALLFDDAGSAFVMYAASGRCWVAMGDPVGERAAGEELAWRFVARCREAGAWPVFYQAHRDRLPLYLDLGLALLKLGEEARVDLSRFELATARKDLRRAHQRARGDGLELVVLPPDEVSPLLPRLRAISDSWLSAKRTVEKGFSLGFFDDAYLSALPLAVVRRAGEPVAFANLWPTGSREELSFDLMRSAPDAPRGAMDFLLIELMRWGRAEGYRWFNLGMAPLSGLRDRPHAPLWNRAAAQLYRHGEQLYHFRGLREYKEKFAPEWCPRYLACPGGLAIPRVLAQLSILINGGVRGVLPRRQEPAPRAVTPP